MRKGIRTLASLVMHKVVLETKRCVGLMIVIMIIKSNVNELNDYLIRLTLQLLEVILGKVLTKNS